MSTSASGIARSFALWRNPAFVRFARSRLRLRKALFWYLLTAIITTFIVTLMYTLDVNNGTSSESAARQLFLPVLIIQGLILMGKGTGNVSAGLIQDKIDQTLDYQRLTPMTPLGNLLGYLFGLPVLEYAMFALTVPHMVFIIAVGEIPAATVLAVYSAFFLCAVLYHLMGIAAGMVMKRWVFGYVLSLFLVLLVNLFLPLFISQFGLKFLQYLSIWPVIGQKVVPLTMTASQNPPFGNPFLTMADEVPFYDWLLSPYVFTVLLQGGLIATLGLMAVRRWQSATRHSLSKLYALAFLAVFVMVAIGNVWPAITGQYMPFALFGQTNLDSLRETIGIGLPIVYSIVVWSLCFLLFGIVTPTHHHYVRGLRRARKLGRAQARMFDDDASSLVVTLAAAAVALVGLLVLYRELGAAGSFDAFVQGRAELWRLSVACVLVLLYTGLVIQVLELKATVLLVLLVWLLPILVATVLAAAMQDVTDMHAVIGAVSPLAYLLVSGFLPLVDFAEMAGDDAAASTMATTANFGLAFIVVQIAFLAWRWRKLDTEFRAAATGEAAAAAGTVAPQNPALEPG